MLNLPKFIGLRKRNPNAKSLPKVKVPTNSVVAAARQKLVK